MGRLVLSLFTAVTLMIPVILGAGTPASAAMDVAKQVLIGADYSNRDAGPPSISATCAKRTSPGLDLRVSPYEPAQDADLSGSDLREATLDRLCHRNWTSDAVLEGAFAPPAQDVAPVPISPTC